MVVDDAYENERKGAEAGLNPMFGDWQHRFEFPPVPYGDGGTKRAEFRKAIQAVLSNGSFIAAKSVWRSGCIWMFRGFWRHPKRRI